MLSQQQKNPYFSGMVDTRGEGFSDQGPSVNGGEGQCSGEGPSMVERRGRVVRDLRTNQGNLWWVGDVKTPDQKEVKREGGLGSLLALVGPQCRDRTKSVDI